MKVVRQDEAGQKAALLTYWLLFTIGVPLWWITTSITKYPLPYSAIKAMIASTPESAVERDNNSIRVKGYPGYQLSFTVISPNDHCPDLTVAYKRRFAPRLAALSASLAYFKVDLQCRLYASASGDDIERFVQGDWNLANSISSLPIINFVIYLGAFKMADGRRSFLYPQWGSVYIKDDAVSEDAMMEELFGHLLLLLGIDDPEDMSKWFAKETERCTAEAIGSLRSLLTILDANRNMPIPKEVSVAVGNAVNFLATLQASKDKEDVKYGLARNALDSAEAAFFHPAMLARQYFPSEHRLAIYVPLFVPLLLPLFVQTVRHFKTKGL